ncbi:MAG TPA: hypothetical protein VGQ83_11585 [Polyangia bacterium]|jgi:hypothetical protein
MELTADDLWPLVSKLPREELVRLARLALGRAATPSSEGESYERSPVMREEFNDEGADPLAWDAEGWEDLA